MTDTLPAPLDVRLMNLAASVLFLGCVVLVLAAGAWWALRHPAFAIGRIVVQGELVHNNAVTLRANVAPELTGNFFTVDLPAARKAFEQVPWVRKAQIRRQYPRTLQVVLQEHHAVAHWGKEPGEAMVNTEGEVFEANGEDAELESLPRLHGPEDQSAQVWQMYQQLQGLLATPIKTLELSGRGGWKVTLEGGAVVELGGGSAQEVRQRAQHFVSTLGQVAAHYGRKPETLESADLRHSNGYAVRLRGVTTVAPGTPTVARK
ncbi:cell division protein FtsQ/DivIB [Giesbergeria anulus]|uniref:Cell division protein FtsQ n=1 Tax=Giesbergeria anulus TaxID=180197 RepID=A0A1H9K9E6_9BURK|nr:cell division protein FtsQ/DivIB [Giesbergeria anulus]SEQ95692.1 cell division protein FtsQ [Giesbergeria anulus]